MRQTKQHTGAPRTIDLSPYTSVIFFRTFATAGIMGLFIELSRVVDKFSQPPGFGEFKTSYFVLTIVVASE